MPACLQVLIDLFDVDIVPEEFELLHAGFDFLFVEGVGVVEGFHISIFDFKLDEKGLVELDSSLGGFQSGLPHLHLRVNGTELQGVLRKLQFFTH